MAKKNAKEGYSFPNNYSLVAVYRDQQSVTVLLNFETKSKYVRQITSKLGLIGFSEQNPSTFIFFITKHYYFTGANLVAETLHKSISDIWYSCQSPPPPPSKCFHKHHMLDCTNSHEKEEIDSFCQHVNADGIDTFLVLQSIILSRLAHLYRHRSSI